ncbi:unnamed protein product [Fusarium graminearum]|nr:unnamed protein product [Fusarium graminearum]
MNKHPLFPNPNGLLSDGGGGSGGLLLIVTVLIVSLGGSGSSSGLLSGRGRGSRLLGTGAGRRSRGRAGASADDKVNARLVGLVDIGSVPEPLENTLASLGAVTTQASRKGNTESSVVGSSTSVGSIVLKLDQRLADHGIRRSLDDGNIGVTSVGSSNVDLKGDLLAEAVLLDIVLVVVELEALAQPEVAVSGLEVLANDLLDALDVAVDVGGLLVEGLVSAGGLVGVAGPAGGGRLDEAVGGDERNESEDSGGVLHFGGSRYKSVLK